MGAIAVRVALACGHTARRQRSGRTSGKGGEARIILGVSRQARRRLAFERELRLAEQLSHFGLVAVNCGCVALFGVISAQFQHGPMRLCWRASTLRLELLRQIVWLQSRFQTANNKLWSIYRMGRTLTGPAFAPGLSRCPRRRRLATGRSLRIADVEVYAAMAKQSGRSALRLKTKLVLGPHGGPRQGRRQRAQIQSQRIWLRCLAHRVAAERRKRTADCRRTTRSDGWRLLFWIGSANIG
jgi:hypothetical protein